MIEVAGRSVCTELSELVDPAVTALLVVDMQRDFLEPDGAFAGLDIDICAYGPVRTRLAGLVVAGCTTEGCVDCTDRDAMCNDYYVVVAPDCAASDDARQHEAALLLMAHRFDLAGSQEIARLWSG